MKAPSALAFVLCLSLLGCRRSRANQPPTTPSDTPPPSAPPSDALVLVPGEGIGAFVLGASRASVEALAGGGRSPDPRTLEIDAITLRFDGDAPGGVVSAIRVRLAGAGGGIRVGNTLLVPTASYPEVVSAVGRCGAPSTDRGATITPCANGAVKILQVGPTQELWLEVSP